MACRLELPVVACRLGLPAMACLLGLLAMSCTREQDYDLANSVDWGGRTVDSALSDSLEAGTTYLSVYSQIYSRTEHKTHDLTVTISIRNTSEADTLFLENAKYFDTKGTLIRSYVQTPVYLTPMETIEIVISEEDREGGTGANFLFDWRVKPGSSEPLFEAVMISTSRQKGLSFSTFGKRIR